MGSSVPEVFLVLLVVVAGFLVLRSGLQQLVATLVGTQEEQKLFDAHTLLITQAWGVVALPAIIVMTVLPETWMWATGFEAGALGVLLVVNLGRGLLIARPHLRARPAHFFAYFCGLNVSPMLLAAKALQLGLLEI
jgi:hypothetical protein